MSFYIFERLNPNLLWCIYMWVLIKLLDYSFPQVSLDNFILLLVVTQLPNATLHSKSLTNTFTQDVFPERSYLSCHWYEQLVLAVFGQKSSRTKFNNTIKYIRKSIFYFFQIFFSINTNKGNINKYRCVLR